MENKIDYKTTEESKTKYQSNVSYWQKKLVSAIIECSEVDKDKARKRLVYVIGKQIEFKNNYLSH